MRKGEHIECDGPAFPVTAERSDGMRLPGGEDIEIPRRWQHVMSHAGTERLQMPVLGSMETELTIKALAIDLRWHLQKDHTGKTAAMGMGWVVVSSALTIEPEIHHLQLVTTGNPGTATLRRLTRHHMSDPAVAGREQVLDTQLLNPRQRRAELSLLAELTGEFRRCIRTGVRISQDIGADTLQLAEK